MAEDAEGTGIEVTGPSSGSEEEQGLRRQEGQR